MALCWETPYGREGSKGFTGGPVTREFCVLHEPSLGAATELVEAESGETFEGRERKSLVWRSLGYDNWMFTVLYGAAAGEGELRPDNFSFRITAGSVHINQSLETLGRVAVGPNLASGTNLVTDPLFATIVVPGDYAPVPEDLGRTIVVTGPTGWRTGLYTIAFVAPGSYWRLNEAPAVVGTAGGHWYMPAVAPDCKGAIGQDNDTVRGCDTIVPTMEFGMTQRRASLTHDDIRLFRSMVGKITDRDFLGYPGGTLQYLGCEPTGSPEGTLPNGAPLAWWALVHQFRHEDDQINVPVGEILLPRVPAFSHVWARYQPKVDAGALAVQPTAVYVERVCHYFNPELLGAF